MKTLNFDYSWQAPDSRPRITAAGISGKTAWIQVEYNGVVFSGTVCKALVKQLRKHSN